MTRKHSKWLNAVFHTWLMHQKPLVFNEIFVLTIGGGDVAAIRFHIFEPETPLLIHGLQVLPFEGKARILKFKYQWNME